MKRMKQEVGEKREGMNATSNDAKDKCQTHFTWDFFYPLPHQKKKISKTNKNFLLFRIRLDHVINDSKLESPLYFFFFIIILLAFYPFLVFLVYFNFFFHSFLSFFLSLSPVLILFQDSGRERQKDYMLNELWRQKLTKKKEGCDTSREKREKKRWK